MERSDIFIRLAAELDARGIDRVDDMPSGSAASVASALGVNCLQLKKMKRHLRLADGDPQLAHTLRNAEGRSRTQRSRVRRYGEDEEYRLRQLKGAKDRRSEDFAYHVFKATRSNARTRGIAFDLTREQVGDLLSPMKCAATGLRLEPRWEGSGRNPWWPSLDQIESRGGYVASNVRVVSWAYNVMRGELDDAEVRSLAKALARGRVDPDPENGTRLLAQRVGRASVTAVLMGRWKASAKARGLNFDVSHEWLTRKLSLGVCEVTGLALTFGHHTSAYRNPLVPSLDRIDTSAGYVEDNLRLVCGWFNYARQDWDDELVITVANALAVNKA